MTQHRFLSAREDRRHPALVPTRSAVTYGVDAAVETMQLPARDAVPDRSRSQTGGFELTPRGDSVLSPRDSRHLEIGRVDFWTHVGT